MYGFGVLVLVGASPKNLLCSFAGSILTDLRTRPQRNLALMCHIVLGSNGHRNASWSVGKTKPLVETVLAENEVLSDS